MWALCCECGHRDAASVLTSIKGVGYRNTGCRELEVAGDYNQREGDPFWTADQTLLWTRCRVGCMKKRFYYYY